MSMMSRLQPLFVTLVVTLFTAPVVANNYTCTGKVQGLSLEPNGMVFAEVIGPLKWQRLCSLEQKFNRVTVSGCKGIYAMLMTAQMSDRSVTLWFNDGKDCTSNSHPPWHSLTGWYFGPKLH